MWNNLHSQVFLLLQVTLTDCDKLRYEFRNVLQPQIQVQIKVFLAADLGNLTKSGRCGKLVVFVVKKAFYRASKSFRCADAHLHKTFKNLCKMCTFECKLGKNRHLTNKKRQHLTNFFYFYMFLWHFKHIPMRKMFSQKICQCIFFLLFEIWLSSKEP